MTVEEQKKADELAKKKAADEKAKITIAKAVSDGITPSMTELKDGIGSLAAEVKALAGANEKSNNMGGSPRIEVLEREPSAEEKGLPAMRVLKAAMTVALKTGGLGMVNNVDPKAVSEQLKAWGYQREVRVFDGAVAKAMEQNVFANGGVFVPQEFSREIIALLRNVTTVRRMGARVIPMGASLEIPKQNAAATAYYVGEGTNITPSDEKMGSIRLAEKKLGALVVISNDLIRNADINAEQFVRDDLLAVLALKEDLTALYGTGGEYSPRGLTSLTPAANQYNAVAASQIAPTLPEIRKELAKAVRVLLDKNIPGAKYGWIINPRTWAYLWALTDGNGNAVYQTEMNAQKLMGYPFLVTNQIPNNLTWTFDGSTDVSQIFFGDWNQYIIGESMSPTIEFFPNAAYDLSGVVQSGISRDQSVMRALQKHDFQLRYPEAFAIIKTRMGA